jgi:hypothetical protein
MEKRRGGDGGYDNPFLFWWQLLFFQFFFFFLRLFSPFIFDCAGVLGSLKRMLDWFETWWGRLFSIFFTLVNNI